MKMLPVILFGVALSVILFGAALSIAPYLALVLLIKLPTNLSKLTFKKDCLALKYQLMINQQIASNTAKYEVAS
jgi:hypothetical protein